LFLAEEDG